MRRLIFGSVLALAGATAQAADNGFYIGAGVSQAKVDDILNTNLEIDNTAWKAIVGFRPLDLIAVEANYMDLGDDSANIGIGTANADYKAVAGFALISLPLPLPLLDVYGKVGLARWEVDGNVNAGGVSLLDASDEGTEFAYGAGAMLTFGSLSARLEYEGFDIDDTDGLDLFTLGVLYTFL
jgi:hypothetical protein